MVECGFIQGDYPDVRRYGQLDDWGISSEEAIEALSAQLEAGEVGYVYEIRFIPVAKITGASVKVEVLNQDK